MLFVASLHGGWRAERLEEETAGKAARGGCGVTPDAQAVWGRLRWAAGHARAGGNAPGTASTRALLRDRSAGRGGGATIKCGRQTRPAWRGHRQNGRRREAWCHTGLERARPGPCPGTLVSTQDALGTLLGRATLVPGSRGNQGIDRLRHRDEVAGPQVCSRLLTANPTPCRLRAFDPRTWAGCLASFSGAGCLLLRQRELTAVTRGH